MNILSIQSHVAYGHVGNAAATFPLQRIGVEVWPIHTVQFSNHTGYGAWTGRVFKAGLITELVREMAQRGVLGTCDGVLSGYMGSAETGAAILDAVAQVKAAISRSALLLRSGDRRCGARYLRAAGHSGIHARPCAARGRYRHAEPVEAGLSGGPHQRHTPRCAGGDRCAAACAGPKAVMVTSLHTDETPADAIDLVASDAEQAASACARPNCNLGQRRGRRRSRPCSLRIICAAGRLRRRSHAPHRRCSAC